MGKVYETIINRFDGGRSEDKRSGWLRSANGATTAKYALSKHFDMMTYSRKILPYFLRETSNGLTGGVVTDLKFARLLYAPTASGGSTFRLWALGANVSGNCKVYELDIDGGSGLDTQKFLASANGESSVSARSEKVFDYYKGYIYMYQGTTSICRFDVTEGGAFADSWQTIDDSTIGVRPLRHPNDDILYFFGKNHVYSLNNTTWNGAVLTLPTDEQITARCAYGNYLAIATVSTGNLAKRSTLYLWDRDSSITTLSERIDLGEGTVKHVANLNNKLMIVMSLYIDNALALSQGKVHIKTPSGNYARTLVELTTDTTLTSSALPDAEFVKENKLFFPMKLTLDGDTRHGVWVVDENGHTTIDHIEPGINTHPAGSAFRDIYPTANIWWFCYDDGAGGAGAYSVTRSDNDALYDATNPCTYETLIDDGGDASLTKKLVGVTVMTDPLPSGGQIVLKYKKQGDSSFTTIFTNSTVSSVSRDAVTLDAGGTLPQYQELQLHVESTGGADLTGIKYKWELIDKQAY